MKNVNSFAISEFFRNNKYINNLTIEELNNQTTVLSRLLLSFKNSQLVSLSLCYAGLDDNSLLVSKKALSTNHFLKRLDLAHNFLTAGCSAVLLKIFTRMPFLSYFSMAGNKIGDEGLQMLLPDILSYVPLETLTLSNCGISDNSYSSLYRTIKIKNNPLSILDMSYNPLSFDTQKQIYKKLGKYNKTDLKILMIPVVIDYDIIKYLSNADCILKRCLDNRKPMPKIVRYRETIDNISAKIDNLSEHAYIEDLVDLISELAHLDFQFPKIRLEKIEKLAYQYLDHAMSQPNYYCLELLVPALRKIGIYHKQAEDLLAGLYPEVEHIINTLINVLSPELYTDENIPEINSLLDNVIKRCDELCIRGEIVQVAKILKNKRDEFVNKKNNF